MKTPNTVVHTLSVREEDGAVVARCTIRYGEVHKGMRLTFRDRSNQLREVEVLDRQDGRKHVDLILGGDDTGQLETGRFLFAEEA